MIAIDTNVVVRYLMADDPAQSERARSLVDSEDVCVCTAVLMETAWVLKSSYNRSPAQIVLSLRSFAGLPTVKIDNKKDVLDALTWADAGLDIADALHLAQSRHCQAFATFDRSFVLAAARLGIGHARLP